MARGDGVDVEEYDNRKHGWPRSSTQAQEQKRKEAMAAANNLTQALVDHLNVGVAQAYLNQKRLDAEAKQLHHNATNFAKQTHQWANLVESFSSALKEIGDAENWAQSIEADMRTITSALEYSYKGLTNNICTKGSLCPFVGRRGIEHRAIGYLCWRATVVPKAHHTLNYSGDFIAGILDLASHRWNPLLLKKELPGLSTHTPFQFDCQIQTPRSLGDRKSTALNTSAEVSENGC
uniref:Biogenesis of lysosome-related organelles complex 1 subunit 1 n=1 Tax=Timema tahoe TaxID=61484 RepID=A0A7R9IDE0_9NEOP|nr:unnamed protein product [Timema tahoe]